MSEPFIGEIRAFGFNYAPRGWAQCNGQIMSVSQNTALFALIGVAYGGNGTTTFGLPDLRGRIAVGLGQRPGGDTVVMGQMSGMESVTLLPNTMPAHTHRLTARATASQTGDPTGAILANGAWVQGSKFGSVQQYAPGSDAVMSQAMLSPSGGNQAHTNLMPLQTQNFCIALTGIFPSRS